jgi:hypothetical protein
VNRLAPNTAPAKLLVIGTVAALVSAGLYLVFDDVAVFYVGGALATGAAVLLGMPHGPSSPGVDAEPPAPMRPRKGARAGTRTGGQS